MKRSIICEEFLKHNEVNCCSKIDNENDAEFNPHGCDCCGGLADDTYPCSGYNPKDNTVMELGDVCHACLCYFANGDDSEV